MLIIRPMSPDDWENISQVDTLAFNSDNQKTGREAPRHHRTQANLRAGLAMNPPGCFVATNDTLVGYIFSRFWGRLGWVGVFGISPDYQGQDIGQKLLMMAINSLEKSGCTTIGLETRSDSPYNAGFYTRFGFNPTYPTLSLTKPATSNSSTLPFGLLSKLEEREAFSCITSLSQAVSQKLDYAMEARNANEYGWGDTLLFDWPQPWGFAIIRTIDSRGESSQPICEVISAALEPKARNRLGEVLQLLLSYAYEKKASQITLPVNAIDNEALQEVIANGFRVSRVMLRMIYRGGYTCPEGIDMSRWAM